jgi:hypothetical protein
MKQVVMLHRHQISFKYIYPLLERVSLGFGGFQSAGDTRRARSSTARAKHVTPTPLFAPRRVLFRMRHPGLR